MSHTSLHGVAPASFSPAKRVSTTDSDDLARTIKRAKETSLSVPPITTTPSHGYEPPQRDAPGTPGNPFGKWGPLHSVMVAQTPIFSVRQIPAPALRGLVSLLGAPQTIGQQLNSSTTFAKTMQDYDKLVECAAEFMSNLKSDKE